MRLREGFNTDDYPDVEEYAGGTGPSGMPETIPGQTGPTKQFNAPGGSARLYPGTGLPGDQVNIQDTEVYVDPAEVAALAKNPNEMARLQQETTLARYGGSPIQDDPEGTKAPWAKPAEGAGAGPAPVFDRKRFEQQVFKDMGGNPFAIDVVKQVNARTAKDLPSLFGEVFKGQVMWEDRARMNPKQIAYWENEVKKYRAHMKESMEAEKKQKTEMYHFMMTNFDKDEKETEVAMKRVQEREKNFLASKKENRIEGDRQAKVFEDLQKEKRDILKRQGEIIKNSQKDMTFDKDGAPIQAGLPPEAEVEMLELGRQLKQITSRTNDYLMKTDPAFRAETNKKMTGEVQPSHKPGASGAVESGVTVPKPTSKKGAEPAAASGKSAGATYPDSKEVFHKPHPAGKPVELKRNKTTGQLMGKMADGSIVVLEELPQP